MAFPRKANILMVKGKEDEKIQKLGLVGSNSKQSLMLLYLIKNIPKIKTNPKHYPFPSFCDYDFLSYKG